MSAVYWLLSFACVVTIIFGKNVHELMNARFPFYILEDPSLIQVILGAFAGIFATKAADSTRDIRRILKISEIQDLLKRADEASAEAEQQQERRRNIVRLVQVEAEAEFARDMIMNHRQQLAYHWNQILKLESLIEDSEESVEDRELRNLVRSYIVKSRYVEYLGRDFLRGIPFFGPILHYFLAPIWDEFYYRNVRKINRLLRTRSSRNSLK